VLTVNAFANDHSSEICSHASSVELKTALQRKCW